tara:strand:+ start:439 stop:912 length:474 start_codon:yes stop_codon:yes gene_type:complete
MAGRPKKTLNKKDAEKITELASTGLGIMDICRSLGISWDVFNRERNNKSYISEAIKRGEALGRKAIVNSLYQNALNGSVPSQIFWLKNKGGEGEWQDKQETEIKINLKEIIGEAQNRIAQHNLNENVIEGEYADKSTDTDSVRLVANKEDIKQANSK